MDNSLKFLARTAAQPRAEIKRKIAASAVLFVLCLKCLAVGAQESARDNEQFQKGVEAFARGDYEVAANIWLIEAYEGSRDAQFNLGVMYLEGKGVPRNREQAVFWFTRAADEGDAEAQYNLGHLYFENKENPESARIAAAWWRRAAQQGYSIAQYSYGRVLFYGVGVEKNIGEARYWMEESAKSGQKVAQRFIDAHAEALQAAADDNRAPPQPVEKPEEEAALTVADEDDDDSAGEVFTLEEKPAEPEEEVALVVVDEDDDDGGGGVFALEEKPIDPEFDHYYVLVGEKPEPLFSHFNAFSPVIFQVEPNLLLKVVDEQGEWLQVHVPGGIPVWIKDEQTRVNNSFIEILGETASIYASPDEDFEVSLIGELEKGSKLLVRFQRPGWYQVQAPETSAGWMRRENLSVVTSSGPKIASVWQAQRIQRKIAALPKNSAAQASAVENDRQETADDQTEAEAGGTEEAAAEASDGSGSDAQRPKQRRILEELTVDEFVTRVGKNFQIQPASGEISFDEARQTDDFNAAPSQNDALRGR